MSNRGAAATNTDRARGWLWWFGILLGGLLVAAGVAETVRLLRTGDRGFAFWFGTLVGGGVLILAGTLLLPRRPAAGGVLTVIGCLAGLLPTMVDGRRARTAPGACGSTPGRRSSPAVDHARVPVS